MSKIVIFGNSGSGKSTLAKAFVKTNNLAHLDLDAIAWKIQIKPERLPIVESEELINSFFAKKSLLGN